MDKLPVNLKHKVNKIIYKATYEKIVFLKNKKPNFITWICPMLKTINFQQDSYIYYEEDLVDSIFFLSKGAAGYVLPSHGNIVYVEIDEGDDFGQSDIISYPDPDIIKNLEKHGSLKRSLTVQALINCECLTLNTNDIIKIYKEFHESFEELIKTANIQLSGLMNQCMLTVETPTDIKRFGEINQQDKFSNFQTRKITMRESTGNKTEFQEILNWVCFHNKSIPL